jgi:hypothetical protein
VVENLLGVWRSTGGGMSTDADGAAMRIDCEYARSHDSAMIATAQAH